MRLYNAICGWLEAHAEHLRSQPEETEQRDTAVDAMVEHGRHYATQPEMHIANRDISIEYDEDHGGIYRHRPISLKWYPRAF